MSVNWQDIAKAVGAEMVGGTLQKYCHELQKHVVYGHLSNTVFTLTETGETVAHRLERRHRDYIAELAAEAIPVTHPEEAPAVAPRRRTLRQAAMEAAMEAAKAAADPEIAPDLE